MSQDKIKDFEKQLEELINRHSKENDSDTPDFILARYLALCLEAGNYLVERREQWYGREKGMLKNIAKKMTLEEMRGISAQGYCTDRNSKKELDSDLLEDIVTAIYKEVYGRTNEPRQGE